MTVLVIILITFPLIIFIMIAPVIVSVDTENEDYSIHWGRLCSIRAVQILEDPLIRLRIGFGTGGGEGDAKSETHGEGAGIGAGMGLEPIGFLVSKNDEIQFVSTKVHKGLATAFEKVPDMIEKYMDMKARERVSTPEPAFT